MTGRRFRAWLLDLRSSHSLFRSSRSSLIDTLLEGYHNARHGTGVSVCVSLFYLGEGERKMPVSPHDIVSATY